MRFKILSIGNSFSDNALKYLYQILDSFGINEIVVGNLYIGGCSIERHYNNIIEDKADYVYRKNTKGSFIDYYDSKLIDGIKDEDWDYITLQQVSGLSGIEDYLNYQVDYIIDYVKKNVTNKNVKIGWHMTWAYQENADHPDFSKYQNSQLEMYNQIIKTVKSKILSNKKFEYLIPAGTAIQNARTSYIGDTLTIDGYHLDKLGEFIAGLSYLKSITNWDLNLMNLDLVPFKFVKYFEVIKHAVDGAIANPFSITNLNYFNNPFNKEKQDYQIYNNISYNNDFEECKLDIYEPKLESFDLVIHFHGGGLSSGYKDDDAHITMGKYIVENGVCFVSVAYRMYPNHKYPDFLIDAANAIKFVLDKYQNRKRKVIISGQSAGAYIGMMLCFNNEYLKEYVDKINGWCIESGQPTTHFELLNQDNLNPNLQRIDERAPIYYINENTKFNDLLLITYTADMPVRKEQNMMLYKTLKYFNPNANVSLRILAGTHCINSVESYRGFYPYVDILLEYLNKINN